MQKLSLFLLILLFSNNVCGINKSSIEKFEEAISKRNIKKDNILELSRYDFTKYNDLSNFNFKSAILKEANFSGMTIEGLNFNSANLENANFKGATIIGCNFKNANLTGAHFDNSSIERSNFNNTKMDYTYFKKSSIEASNFDKSKMNCVYFDNSTILRSNFKQVIAHGISLKNVDMNATSKENAILKSDLTHCFQR